MSAKVTYRRPNRVFTPLDSFKSQTDTIENEAKLLTRRRLNSRRYLTGLTLIEIMLAILVMMVIAIGTAGYRYYSAMDARRAVKEAVASRIALLLNESWRGILGSNIYDPITQLTGPDFNISSSGGPSEPAGFSKLGSYKVVSDNASYFITLAYNPVMTDPLNATHKRTALTTIVAWPITTNESSYMPQYYSNFVITTYVENGTWR